MLLKGTEPKANKGKRANTLFPLFLIVALFILVIPRPAVLWIENIDRKDGKERAVFFLKEKEEFVIAYTHSVDLLPVYETFYSQDDSIYLKETRFYNFGAGMGLLEGRGRYIEEDGMLKIVDLHEQLDFFLLRTGLIADQHLVYREARYSLTARFGEDARLLFQIKSIPLYRALFEVYFTGRYP